MSQLMHILKFTTSLALQVDKLSPYDMSTSVEVGRTQRTTPSLDDSTKVALGESLMGMSTKPLTKPMIGATTQSPNGTR